MADPIPAVQRRCACGGGCPICRSGRQSGSPGIADRAPRAVLPQGGGSSLDRSVRESLEPRFGYDFSGVRIHTDKEAAASASALDSLAYTTEAHIVFGAGQYAPHSVSGRRLLAHELAHVVQQDTGGASPELIQRGKSKAAAGVVGWLVKVGKRKLIKTAAIYSDNELAKLLGKGYNILVTRGSAQAKAVARKVWGDRYIHHTGHIIADTGKRGLPHFQPARHLRGRAGERGWHVFYAAAPVLFFAPDVEAMEVYEDKYPGKSIANYLTFTQYFGEESWVSTLDWVNPLELIAIGGDVGRNFDRERTKVLRAVVFSRVASDGTIQTYELDPEGQLVQVILERPGGEVKYLTADQYFTFVGLNMAPVPSAALPEDGTASRHYSSTFDADYRIYNSKSGWHWESETLSFFLPEDDSARLQGIGDFWVLENLSVDYVYAYAHPRERAVLQQPGFLIPEDYIPEYLASDKAAYLQQWLESAKKLRSLLDLDLWKAK